MTFLATSYAQEPDYKIVVEGKRRDFQAIQIYVDISEVIAPDGSRGTSNALNNLITHYSQKTSYLDHKMHRHASPEVWNGSIHVYDWNNIKYMPAYKACDYSDALKCGVQNRHWTLRTVVTVGKKYTTVTQRLYNEHGRQISSSSQTAWGKIRWKPQWKITKINESGGFGGNKKTEVIEIWPPIMEELPPLLKPKHIYQLSFGVYEVKLDTCTVKACESKKY